MTRSRWPAVLVAVGIISASSPPARAMQGPPGTDIYLVSVSTSAGRLVLGPARNLTAAPGYQNQPAWLGTDTLVFAAAAEGGQTDICGVLPGRPVRFCTETRPESEYSPTPMPGGGLSVVRVERDSTQRLWRLAAGEWSVLLPDLKPVGYHAWLDADRVLLFLLGSPPVAALAHRGSGRVDTVARNVGRSLHRIPGSAALSFPQRVDSAWWIVRYDPESRRTDPVAPALAGSQDHAWLADGSLLMARGNRLYRWTPGEPGWELLRVFSEPGLQQITRLAVSPAGDALALVGQDPGP